MTKPLKKKANQHWLDIGMNALFNHQVGVIKYIGRVEFSDGIWLGEKIIWIFIFYIYREIIVTDFN